MKQHLVPKYERILWRIRQRIFDYDDATSTKATRIIQKIKGRCMPWWEIRAREVAEPKLRNYMM